MASHLIQKERVETSSAGYGPSLSLDCLPYSSTSDNLESIETILSLIRHLFQNIDNNNNITYKILTLLINRVLRLSWLSFTTSPRRGEISFYLQQWPERS